MDAHLSFATSLMLSLALWWGSMNATLRGDLELANSGIRFVLAFIFARFAVNLINHLLHTYQQTQQRVASSRVEVQPPVLDPVANDTHFPQKVSEAPEQGLRRTTDLDTTQNPENTAPAASDSVLDSSPSNQEHGDTA